MFVELFPNVETPKVPSLTFERLFSYAQSYSGKKFHGMRFYGNRLLSLVSGKQDIQDFPDYGIHRFLSSFATFAFASDQRTFDQAIIRIQPDLHFQMNVEDQTVELYQVTFKEMSELTVAEMIKQEEEGEVFWKKCSDKCHSFSTEEYVSQILGPLSELTSILYFLETNVVKEFPNSKSIFKQCQDSFQAVKFENFE
jgi:hypothetical protein